MLKWNATREESDLIKKIAARAYKMFGPKSPDGTYYGDPMEPEMDVTATHLNGCPLDLEKLLVADDFVFAHDMLGIREHLNCRTGFLRDCFVPRCVAVRTVRAA